MKQLLNSNLNIGKTLAEYSIILIFFMSGCGAVSTSGRYETGDSQKEKTETEKVETAETFNLKPYRPDLNLETKEFITDVYTENSGAWFEYDSIIEPNKNKKIVGTEDGYRVQVIATDDLDEANKINTEINSQIPTQRSYVNFEPPFYKVKVGDFTEISEANNLRFRLSQMGFTESKVVRETINIFEK